MRVRVFFVGVELLGAGSALVRLHDDHYKNSIPLHFEQIIQNGLANFPTFFFKGWTDRR